MFICENLCPIKNCKDSEDGFYRFYPVNLVSLVYFSRLCPISDKVYLTLRLVSLVKTKQGTAIFSLIIQNQLWQGQHFVLDGVNLNNYSAVG